MSFLLAHIRVHIKVFYAINFEFFCIAIKIVLFSLLFFASQKSTIEAKF